MDWLTSGWGIIAGILGIGFVIAIHELGHYLFAKWAGVRVHEFAIGFGPVVWSKRIGETEYSLHLLPAGGYVAMQEQPLDADGQPLPDGDAGNGDGRSFQEASKSWRAAILAAGVLFNLVSSFLILLVLAWAGMPLIPATVGQVAPMVIDSEGEPVESPGALLGLRSGDHIRRYNGERIYSFEDLIGQVLVQGDQPVRLVIERDGERLELPPGEAVITPVGSKRQGRPTLGIQAPESRRIVAIAGGEGELQRGDRVVAVAGTDTTSMIGQAVRELMQPWVGRELELTVLRDGERVTVQVPFAGTDPSSMASAALGLPVLVNEVIAGMPAEAAGLRAGDVVAAVGGELVRSSEHLTTLIQRHGADDARFALVLYRRQDLPPAAARALASWWRLLGVERTSANGGWLRLERELELAYHQEHGRELIGITMDTLQRGLLPPLNPALGSDQSPLRAAGIASGDILLDIAYQGDEAATVRYFERGQALQLALSDAEFRALARFQQTHPLLKFFGRRDPPALVRQLTAARIDAIDPAAGSLRAFDPIGERQLTVDLTRLDDSAPELRRRLERELAVGDWVLGLTGDRRHLAIVRGAPARPTQVAVTPARPGVAVTFTVEELPHELEAWYHGFGLAAKTSTDMLTLTFRVVGKFFKDRDEGGIDVSKSLHGPVGIFSELKARADAGFGSLLKFVALLGLNLVIINLLPIPLTDGGRLILLGIEAVMRRPVPERIATLINVIGLVFLVGLMLYVLGLDILRQLGRH